MADTSEETIETIRDNKWTGIASAAPSSSVAQKVIMSKIPEIASSRERAEFVVQEFTDTYRCKRCEYTWSEPYREEQKVSTREFPGED